MEVPMFYNEQEEWARALLLYDSVLREINTKLEILNNEFKMTHQYNPIEHITSRIKSPQSIAKKIRHQERELTVENIIKYINDVAGIRIICSFTSDIYRIADLITQQSDVKILKIKDYIMNPKPNGYMSYHMIVSVPIFLSGEVVETKAEIQIRTIAMDFWASLEHKMYYKFEGNAPEHIRKELKECADIVAYLDQKMLSLNEQIKNYRKEFLNQEVAVAAETSVLLKKSYGTVVDEEELTELVQEIPEEQVQDMLGALQEKAIQDGIYKQSEPETTKQKKQKNTAAQAKESKNSSGRSWFQTSFFGWDKKKQQQETLKNA